MYFITDYVQDPDIEREILGEPLVFENRHKAHVLLVWHEQIDDEYLAAFNCLKGVVRYGVGYDNIDLQALKERNIVFCNTPDYGVEEVSDTAVAMLLGFFRGVMRYDRDSRLLTGTLWQEEVIPMLRRSSGQTVGVIGAGRIGGSVCRKMKALGFNVSFFDPYLPSGYEKMIGVNRVSTLEELLSISDAISIHTPLTEETRGLVDDQFVRLLKSGAFLINTARGEIIKSLDVIYSGLQSGQLENVALDVLPQEPPDFSHPLIKAWRADDDLTRGRLVINPHSAFYSLESYEEMRKSAATNGKRILEGLTPLNIVRV